jgi:hypothetical protein
MLVLLAILIFIYNFAAQFFFASRLELSPAVEYLYAAAFWCAAIWWLRSDAHRSSVTPLYCQGLMMGIGWFVIIPYHLLKTRGAKGFLPLLLLSGSFVGARVAGELLYVALFGLPVY